jgi:CRP-like cAMP-binding protein
VGLDLSVSLGEIGRLELFRSLSDDAVREVRVAMQVKRVAKDTVIFEQGQWVDRAYALALGSVRIVQTGSDGGHAIVRFIGPDEVFGAVPLFTDHRFPADAIAAENSTVLSWREKDLLRLIDRYPTIALNVVRVLGQRIGQLQERVREVSTQRAEQRLAHAVIRLAEQAGRSGPRGTTIEIPLRRKDLAEFAGTTLHTASRTVAAWEKAGLLASNGRRIVVHDLAVIRGLAEGCDT